MNVRHSFTVYPFADPACDRFRVEAEELCRETEREGEREGSFRTQQDRTKGVLNMWTESEPKTFTLFQLFLPFSFFHFLFILVFLHCFLQPKSICFIFRILFHFFMFLVFLKYSFNSFHVAVVFHVFPFFFFVVVSFSSVLTLFFMFSIFPFCMFQLVLLFHGFICSLFFFFSREEHA